MVMVGSLGSTDCRLCGASDGFESGIWGAIDIASEGFGVGTPAYMESSSLGVGSVSGGMWV